MQTYGAGSPPFPEIVWIHGVMEAKMRTAKEATMLGYTDGPSTSALFGSAYSLRVSGVQTLRFRAIDPEDDSKPLNSLRLLP